MPAEKKFVPGKGMVGTGKEAGVKKEAVPPKKGAAGAKPPAKAPAKKAVPPKKK